MKKNIRKWSEKDIIQIADIEKQCIKLPWTVNMLLTEYKNDFFNCYVYEKDNIICGYLNYHIVCDEYHIANIAVKSVYRKQGIANNLFDYVINKAKNEGIKGITLEVGEKNLPAISLYTKKGFNVEAKRKNYYKTEDAFLMWKYL